MARKHSSETRSISRYHRPAQPNRQRSPSVVPIDATGARGSSGQGLGVALDPGLRSGLESRLGTSLAGLRIHADSSSAVALRARAFTLGNDIHFAPQQFDLQSPQGRLRLVHEVVHNVQQHGSGGGDHAVNGSSSSSAEHEAWQGANAVLAGQNFRVRQRIAPQVQRDDTDTPEVRPFSTLPEFQLQLSPEIEAMLLQTHIRRWMAGLWLNGSPPSDTSTQSEAETQAEGDTQSVPSPDAAPASASQTGPTAGDSTPLPPAFFGLPSSADSQSPTPDAGALLAPFNARQVPAGVRDVNEVMTIYRRNYRFVSFLPDLRSAVPGLVRPLIPIDWRRNLAETLTSATVDNQLKHDFPTLIELSDQFIFNATGIRTTYLPPVTVYRF